MAHVTMSTSPSHTQSLSSSSPSVSPSQQAPQRPLPSAADLRTPHARRSDQLSVLAKTSFPSQPPPRFTKTQPEPTPIRQRTNLTARQTATPDTLPDKLLNPNQSNQHNQSDGVVRQYVYESDYSPSEANSLSEGLSSSNSLDDSSPSSASTVELLLHPSSNIHDQLCGSSRRNSTAISSSAKRNTAANFPNLGASHAKTPSEFNVSANARFPLSHVSHVTVDALDSSVVSDFPYSRSAHVKALNPPAQSHGLSRLSANALDLFSTVSTCASSSVAQSQCDAYDLAKQSISCAGTTCHSQYCQCLHCENGPLYSSNADLDVLANDIEQEQPPRPLEDDVDQNNLAANSSMSCRRRSSTVDNGRDEDVVGSEVSSAGLALCCDDRDPPPAPVMPFLSLSSMSGLESSLEVPPSQYPLFIAADDARPLFASDSSGSSASSLSISLDIVRPMLHSSISSHCPIAQREAYGECWRSEDDHHDCTMDSFDEKYMLPHDADSTGFENVSLINSSMADHDCEHGTGCLGSHAPSPSNADSWTKAIAFRSSRRCRRSLQQAASKPSDVPLSMASTTLATRKDSVALFLEEEGTHPRVAIVDGRFCPIPLSKLHSSRCRENRFCVYHPSDPYAFDLRVARHVASHKQQGHELDDGVRLNCRRRSSTAMNSRRRRASRCGLPCRDIDDSPEHDDHYEHASSLSALAARLSDLQVNPFSRCSTPSDASSIVDMSFVAHEGSDNGHALRQSCSSLESPDGTVSPAKAIRMFGFLPDPVRVHPNGLLACRSMSVKSRDRDALASSIISSDSSCRDSWHANDGVASRLQNLV